MHTLTFALAKVVVGRTGIGAGRKIAVKTAAVGVALKPGLGIVETEVGLKIVVAAAVGQIV